MCGKRNKSIFRGNLKREKPPDTHENSEKKNFQAKKMLSGRHSVRSRSLLWSWEVTVKFDLLDCFWVDKTSSTFYALFPRKMGFQTCTCYKLISTSASSISYSEVKRFQQFQIICQDRQCCWKNIGDPDRLYEIVKKQQAGTEFCEWILVGRLNTITKTW